jgi:uncharacterized membrane protein AbrB (regulator of aidB expression)
MNGMMSLSASLVVIARLRGNMKDTVHKWIRNIAVYAGIAYTFILMVASLGVAILATRYWDLLGMKIVLATTPGVLELTGIVLRVMLAWVYPLEPPKSVEESG